MTQSRIEIARDIQRHLLQEWGESVDLPLLLGVPAYGRAVLSLCRSSGSARLRTLAEQFVTTGPGAPMVAPSRPAPPTAGDWQPWIAQVARWPANRTAGRGG